MTFKIGLAQADSGNSKDESLKKAVSLMEEASSKKVEMIVFPEFFMEYVPLADPIEKYASVAEPLNGPFVSTISYEADKRKMYVAVGIYEKPTVGQRIHNTIVLIGPDGSILSANRKLHSFDAFGFNESEKFKSGEDPGQVADTTLGKIGTMVCYDLRFPEATRMQVMDGAEILLVPAAWLRGIMKEDHWITLVKARAIENTIFVAACSQPGRMFSGRSMVVDPFGITLCDGGAEESLVVTNIDLQRIKKVRERLPCLDQIRMDIATSFWTRKLQT